MMKMSSTFCLVPLSNELSPVVGNDLLREKEISEVTLTDA
jgi:hypothetical protein